MKSFALLVCTTILATTAFARDITAQIKVSGMTCQACAISVQKSLERTKGVKHAEVSSDKGLTTVTYDDTQVTEQQLRTAIDKTGFKSEPSQEKK